MNQTQKQHDIYQEITTTVIEALENGDIIWQKPWNSLGLPKNLVSNKTYRGWNVYWLNFVTVIKEYKTPYFLTFKQAQQLGGTIRKGQKGTRITYWATVSDKDDFKPMTDLMPSEQNSKAPEKLIPVTHTVFNYDQTEGIVLCEIEKLFRTMVNPIEECETILRNMPQKPAIRTAGDQAYYQPSIDLVTMPDRTLFHTEEAYYTSFFHELAHSTGHAKRLNRNELTDTDGFGAENYSKEELTAELTAAFLCATAGISQPTINNTKAYIKGWLKALKSDKMLVYKAASQAQKAADYILHIEQQ